MEKHNQRVLVLEGIGFEPLVTIRGTRHSSLHFASGIETKTIVTVKLSPTTRFVAWLERTTLKFDRWADQKEMEANNKSLYLDTKIITKSEGKRRQVMLQFSIDPENLKSIKDDGKIDLGDLMDELGMPNLCNSIFRFKKDGVAELSAETYEIEGLQIPS